MSRKLFENNFSFIFRLESRSPKNYEYLIRIFENYISLFVLGLLIPFSGVVGSETSFSSKPSSFKDDIEGMGALIDRTSSTGSSNVAGGGRFIS